MPKRLTPALAAALALLSILIITFFLGLYPSSQKESGRFKIHEVKKNVSSIQTTIAYIGKLDSIPCRIYLQKSDNRPLANKDYFFSKGTLRERSKGLSNNFSVKSEI